MYFYSTKTVDLQSMPFGKETLEIYGHDRDTEHGKA